VILEVVLKTGITEANIPLMEELTILAALVQEQLAIKR